MEDSILNSVKKYVGIDKSMTAFDEDILMNVNAVFSTLYQLGVDSAKDVMIIGDRETWSDIFGKTGIVNLIRQYTFLKVRIIFDPPTNSFVLDAMKKQADELEWRINIESEGGFDSDEE